MRVSWGEQFMKGATVQDTLRAEWMKTPFCNQYRGEANNPQSNTHRGGGDGGSEGGINQHMRERDTTEPQAESDVQKPPLSISSPLIFLFSFYNSHSSSSSDTSTYTSLWEKSTPFAWLNAPVKDPSPAPPPSVCCFTSPLLPFCLLFFWLHLSSNRDIDDISLFENYI